MGNLVVAWVHLGKNRIPDYLLRNIARLEIQYSKVLIVDNSKNVERLKHTNVEVVRIPNVQEQWKSISNAMNHDLTFRGAFWFNSIARLKALEMYSKRNPATALLHLESDVVVLPTFPFDKFEELGAKLAFPFESINRGIASILYLGSHALTLKLTEFCEMRIQSDSKLTDMIALGQFQNEYPEDVVILPTVDTHFGSGSFSSLEKFGENKQLFGGFFDGITIGQYLFGIDPRNRRGIRQVYSRNPGHLVDASKLNFSWTGEEFKIRAGSEEYLLHNLHVHSKDIRLFSSYGFNRMVTKRLVANKEKVRNEIVVKIFLSSALAKLLRYLRTIVKSG